MIFTPEDLERAANEGVIDRDAVRRLVAWQAERLRAAPAGLRAASTASAESGGREPQKAFNLVTVAYYFGAMLMISACAWFLGDKWDALGSGGVLVTTVVYAAVCLGLGFWLRGNGYPVGGGLLVTVAVCLVPLATYSVESLLGFWPEAAPGAYKDFYPLIRGSWIVMELATMAAAAIALMYVRFGFLTAPLAFAAWFLSMDLWALLRDAQVITWEDRQAVSIIVGLVTIGIGFLLDRLSRQRGRPTSEDFAFWCYLFGLAAFWGGLTSMSGSTEIGKFFYLLLNIGLVAVALVWRRVTFLVFGAMGVHAYLGHLAYTVFRDSFFFPFVLAALGLSLILSTVAAQRFMRRRSDPNGAT